MNLKLIRKVTKHRIKKNFDEVFDDIREMAKNDHNYEGDIKVINDGKYIGFYIII